MKYPTQFWYGDLFGVRAIGWGRKIEPLFTPRTDRFHFGIIAEYIADEDDYVIVESVPGFLGFKGLSLGRLSEYSPSNIEVYRPTLPNERHWGQLAYWALTNYGKVTYDYLLILRLVLDAIRLVLIKRRLPPWQAWEFRYVADNAFVCTEAANAGWAMIGLPIIPAEEAPLPSAFREAELEGRIIRIYP